MGSSPGQIVNLRQKKTYMFNGLCNLAIMLSVCYIVSPSIVLPYVALKCIIGFPYQRVIGCPRYIHLQ